MEGHLGLTLGPTWIIQENLPILLTWPHRQGSLFQTDFLRKFQGFGPSVWGTSVNVQQSSFLPGKVLIWSYLANSSSQVALVVKKKKKPTYWCRRHKKGRFDPCLGRSPGGGHGNLLQYSCLENPMDRGTGWATVHGVARSWTCTHCQFLYWGLFPCILLVWEVRGTLTLGVQDLFLSLARTAAQARCPLLSLFCFFFVLWVLWGPDSRGWCSLSTVLVGCLRESQSSGKSARLHVSLA